MKRVGQQVLQALRAIVRGIAWTIDATDSRGDPSLSKGLAFALGVVLVFKTWADGFTWLNIAAMGVVLSAAFGRSVFMQWLSRNQWSSNAQLTGDLAKLAEVATRNAEEGYQPSGKVLQVHDD